MWFGSNYQSPDCSAAGQ
ncbi:hypothetical protein LEMLEM_LOCUS10035 [Lemmus lemmus]